MMVVFSEHEKMVLKILGRRKMTIHEIADEFYHSREVELAPRNYVAFVIRRITAKCKKMKLKWTLEGKGVGRGGRTVWRANSDSKTLSKRTR